MGLSYLSNRSLVFVIFWHLIATLASGCIGNAQPVSVFRINNSGSNAFHMLRRDIRRDKVHICSSLSTSFPNAYQTECFSFDLWSSIPNTPNSPSLKPSHAPYHSLVPRMSPLPPNLNHLHIPALLIIPSNSCLSTPCATPAPPFASRIILLNNSSSTSSFSTLATLLSVASVILPSPFGLNILNASSTSLVCESEVRDRLWNFKAQIATKEL